MNGTGTGVKSIEGGGWRGAGVGRVVTMRGLEYAELETGESGAGVGGLDIEGTLGLDVLTVGCERDREPPLNAVDDDGTRGREACRGGECSSRGSRTCAGDVVRTGESADMDEGVSARVNKLIGG